MYIFGVLILSVMESVTRYLEHSWFNETGAICCVASFDLSIYLFHDYHSNYVRTATGALSASIMFTLLRKTFARLLILVVVMGYGVIKPTLGSQKWQVILYAVLYLVLGSLFEFMNALYKTHDVSVFSLILFAFPVALMDALLYTWVLSFPMHHFVPASLIHCHSM